jgi:iron(II)-dependent oxidoreductase
MHNEVREHETDGSPMVLVPAGPFLMGLLESDFLAEDHEKPQRTVHLSAFWIDVYPVTNARFARFMQEGGYDDPARWTAEGWTWRCSHDIRAPLTWGQAGWDGADQPVAGVCWYEAAAYARWAGRRLPTDAEWERACRGQDTRRYPWGDEWPSPARVNFGMSIGRTTPVGLYPPSVSPAGCHDMAGNVNNWTADWYWAEFGLYCLEHELLHDPCLDDELRARLGVEGIVERVDRGGGFATPREFHEVVGCTRKVHWTPETREPWNGFRTAVSA